MRAYAIAVYVFLYAPIALIVLFSFNSGNNASDFQGLSALWYGKAAANPFVKEAVVNSLVIAGLPAEWQEPFLSSFGTAEKLKP